MKYRVCVVSSSRADFGLLRPLLVEIKSKENLDLQFIVTGSHLSHDHGYTIEEVEASGININRKIDISIENTNAVAIGETLARTVLAFSNELGSLSPHLIVILGDRYEMLGVATAAMCLTIPIAHLHGGELTQGAIDDSIRHAITKLSHLHFVCNDVYRKRVIQMGESPERVFNTGSLGVENIANIKPTGRYDLENQLQLKFSKTNIMVSYHSTTLPQDDTKSFDIMLKDLRILTDTTLIFTMPNADLGGKTIENKIRSFCLENSSSFFIKNLGLHNYISCLKQCDFLVGNSSSGILEAPFLGCYSINVGTRQLGRLQASTVINVLPWPGEIHDVIISLKEKILLHGRPKQNQIFGDGSTSTKIVSIIENEITKLDLKKIFFFFF